MINFIQGRRIHFCMFFLNHTGLALLFFVLFLTAFSFAPGRRGEVDIGPKFFRAPSLLLFTGDNGEIRVFCTHASTGYFFKSIEKLKDFCGEWGRPITAADFDAKIVLKVYLCAESEAIALAEDGCELIIPVDVAMNNSLKARQALAIWSGKFGNLLELGARDACSGYLQKKTSQKRVLFCVEPDEEISCVDIE
jgi:hypothetical protein